MSQKQISDAEKNLLRTYGRRRMKTLRPTRADAMEEILSTFSVPAGKGALDLKSLFGPSVKKIWLEIGFGSGEHLLRQAMDNPAVGIIGCEPFINGVAALCVGVRREGVKNVRIWPDDARLLMGRLKSGSIERLFLLHPDPWPKTRHHKRRFIQKETLDEIARLLKSGGELRMATDDPGMAAWLLQKTYFHPAFEWQAKCADDWRKPPKDWPETRYGQKGLKQGRPPAYLIFKRV